MPCQIHIAQLMTNIVLHGSFARSSTPKTHSTNFRCDSASCQTRQLSPSSQLASLALQEISLQTSFGHFLQLLQIRFRPRLCPFLQTHCCVHTFGLKIDHHIWLLEFFEHLQCPCELLSFLSLAKFELCCAVAAENIFYGVQSLHSMGHASVQTRHLATCTSDTTTVLKPSMLHESV